MTEDLSWSQAAVEIAKVLAPVLLALVAALQWWLRARAQKELGAVVDGVEDAGDAGTKRAIKVRAHDAGVGDQLAKTVAERKGAP